MQGYDLALLEALAKAPEPIHVRRYLAAARCALPLRHTTAGFSSETPGGDEAPNIRSFCRDQGTLHSLPTLVAVVVDWLLPPFAPVAHVFTRAFKLLQVPFSQTFGRI